MPSVGKWTNATFELTIKNVSGSGAPWDVPVHVIASRQEVFDRLVARGFRTGLTPTRPDLGRMHELLPVLLQAFGDSP